MAGYFDVFATFRVRTHLPDFVGATNRLVLIEHGPLSDHVFLPVEIDRIIQVRGVFDFLATTVFITVNPGRATTFADGALLPADVRVEMTKEYSVPFESPETVHVVALVVHTAFPFEFVTMYVTGRTLDTADQVNVTVLLATLAVIAVGVNGGPCGVTNVEAAPFPFALDATTEAAYFVPFSKPVKEHELPPTTVHLTEPGVAVTTYVVPN